MFLKVILTILAILAVAFILMVILALAKKKSSVYGNEPEQRNRLEGKRVVFVARFADKPYLAIVGSHIDEFIGDTSNVISKRIVPTTSEEIYNFAKKRSAFNHPTVMLSKTAVLENGGYSDLKRNQDVDLFGRMLFKGYKAENIDESLLWFRSSDELAKRRKSWQNTWSYIGTIRKFWKMGYSSVVDYITVFFAQTGMYLLPIKVQNLVYKKFLRK